MIKESDQLKIDIIAKVSAGLLMRKTAAKILRKNVNTITRYLKEYKKMGALFVIHKATGKRGHNKTDDNLKENV